ncbi:ATP-binding protein [Methylobacterium sp. JK268]
MRWTLGIAAWSMMLALLIFAFVYWQTARVMEADLAEHLGHELRFAASDPAQVAARIETWIHEDLHNVHFAGLFASDGGRQGGNLERMPVGIPPDGSVRRIGTQVVLAGRRLHEELWAAALALPDGRRLVIAHDTDEIDRLAQTVTRALGLALVPALVLSVAGGAVLAGRGRRRVATTEAAIERLRRGDLSQRLPVGEADDEFDRLARKVNALLDEIERLVEEVRGVGDAVAHDLRTPLTRLRARLEVSRDQARSVEEFREAVDQGLGWIDQTLAMVSAVLRIGEIEHGRRREGFADVDLTRVVGEAVEFIEPAAEDKGVAVRVEAGTACIVRGDRDLLFEALLNLLDNAVKFTPPGGLVAVGLARRDGGTMIAVEDSGPGIPPGERDRVFRRFYRMKASGPAPGNGLGLALVAAVADLHGFPLRLDGSALGGCRVELRCPDPREAPEP